MSSCAWTAARLPRARRRRRVVSSRVAPNHGRHHHGDPASARRRPWPLGARRRRASDRWRRARAKLLTCSMCPSRPSPDLPPRRQVAVRRVAQNLRRARRHRWERCTFADARGLRRRMLRVADIGASRSTAAWADAFAQRTPRTGPRRGALSSSGSPRRPISRQRRRGASRSGASAPALLSRGEGEGGRVRRPDRLRAHNGGQAAPAAGWIARGIRLLEETDGECPERGFCSSLRTVARAGRRLAWCRGDRGRARAGHAVRDSDLTTLARNVQGRALIARASGRRDAAALEAMAA